MLSMQWFCKIPFLDSTSFELQVLIAECVSLESHEKKICWLSQQGTEKSIFRVIFRIGFGIMTTMILQNTISRFNFFRIESFDSWVCYFGKPRNKTKIRVIFRIGFDVITTMILYLSILPQKEHFEHVLSSLCMLISVCAFKLVYFFSLTGCTCCT